MITSYHTHTSRSDGDEPLIKLIEGAISLGVDELGVSDHLVLPQDGSIPDWSMPLQEVPEYVQELQFAAQKFRDQLTIRIGIEADYDPLTVNEMREVLQSFPFDYVIGSVHFVDGFPIDKCPEVWDEISQSERNDIILAYWDRIRQMAESALFDFAGHLDLYKKFGHGPTVDLATKIEDALDAIAASGIAIEINTAGWHKPVGEAYPSPYILRRCRQRGIPLVIAADAHRPEHLTRDYGRAVELAKTAGYEQLVRFSARRRAEYPLSDQAPHVGV